MNYSISVEASRLQQVVNAIDAGAGFGVMRLLDASNATLTSITLPKPCATVTNDLLSFSGLAAVNSTPAVAGTVKGARFEDSTGTVVISGLTVGAVGDVADIVFAPTNVIAAGQTLALTAATITGN